MQKQELSDEERAKIIKQIKVLGWIALITAIILSISMGYQLVIR